MGALRTCVRVGVSKERLSTEELGGVKDVDFDAIRLSTFIRCEGDMSPETRARRSKLGSFAIGPALKELPRERPDCIEELLESRDIGIGPAECASGPALCARGE